MRRGHEPRVSAFTAGLIALALLAVATYFIFAQAIPFQHHYQVRAVMPSSNLLQERSVVRIAGVDVGQVDKVERYKDTRLALVTMRIEDHGRPVHRDATIKIRPRLFLEGNFYVDLKPGTARAPEIPDGGMIPVAQTARPVQLDEILNGLPAPTRASLRASLRGLADAFDKRGPNGEPTGAEALNRTLRTSTRSFRDSAVVGQALVGPTGRELSRAIAGFARATRAIAQNEDVAAALIRDLNATMGALAAHAPALERTVEALGPAAVSARAGFESLNRALGPTRRFARDLVPGVKATPAVIDASRPWIEQTVPLLGDDELGGWLRDFRDVAPDLARLASTTQDFLPKIHDFNRCITDVFLPSGMIEIDDGPLSTGVENYKELWYGMVGQAGEGAGFDGNGSFLRLAAAPGDQMIETGKTNWGKQSYFATLARKPRRTSPAYTSKLPPLRRDVKCFTQPVPDVNGAGASGPADGSSPGAAAPPIHDPESAK